MIKYHTSTRVWLSLENYYNQGITPEEAKKVIENLKDLSFDYHIHCEASGLNQNWIFDVHDECVIPEIISAIDFKLWNLVREKKNEASRKITTRISRHHNLD